MCCCDFFQWMEWHPCAPVLLAGTADGNTWMWKIPSGECKTFQGPNCQATSGKIIPDGVIFKHLSAVGIFLLLCYITNYSFSYRKEGNCGI